MRIKIKNLTIPLLIIMKVCVLESIAQTSGSLYLLPENFHTQMLNPVLTQTGDSVIVIAVPGFGGGMFGNSGSFKFNELIRRQPDGKMALDLEYFYNHGNSTTELADWSSIPYFFLGLPTKKGRLNFFMKENLFSSLKMNTRAIDFFNNGNFEEEYRSYNTEEANISAISYRELTVGYATSISKKISYGLHGKILFGAILAEFRNWEYGIETSENGDAVKLSSSGLGKLSLPFKTDIRNDRLQNIYTENGLSNYLKNYHNPGLAVDIGIKYKPNEQSLFSISVSDLGGIWFRHRAFDIKQNSEYNFKGFDLSNTLDKNVESGNFIDSYDLMFNTKENIRDVFRLETDTASFYKSLPVKTAFHYQYSLSESIILGLTNQTVIFRNNVLNNFSFSSKQMTGNFSFFENININKLNNLSVGGGFQWEGANIQFYFATDNFLAVYHPASQETFTVSGGLCLILNKKGREKNGDFLPYLPFYEKK